MILLTVAVIDAVSASCTGEVTSFGNLGPAGIAVAQFQSNGNDAMNDRKVMVLGFCYRLKSRLYGIQRTKMRHSVPIS